MNKVNMSQIRNRVRPFRHTRESGYPVVFFPDSLLDSCLRRNDDEEGIKTEVDLKSTYFPEPLAFKAREDLVQCVKYSIALFISHVTKFMI